MFESDPPRDEINPIEANYWWRQATAQGALLNKLMVLFIVVPIVLVVNRFYAVSFFVFLFMIPYGFLMRHLAVRAVRQHLQEHPEERGDFERAGIVLT